MTALSDGGGYFKIYINW